MTIPLILPRGKNNDLEVFIKSRKPGEFNLLGRKPRPGMNGCLRCLGTMAGRYLLPTNGLIGVALMTSSPSDVTRDSSLPSLTEPRSKRVAEKKETYLNYVLICTYISTNNRLLDLWSVPNYSYCFLKRRITLYHYIQLFCFQVISSSLFSDDRCFSKGK